MPHNETPALTIEVLCDLSNDALTAFTRLMSSIVENYFSDVVPQVARIIIVDDARLVPTATALLQALTENDQAKYRADLTTSRSALVIPHQGSGRSVMIFSKGAIEACLPTEAGATEPQAVSTLLEEFAHVRFYALDFTHAQAQIREGIKAQGAWDLYIQCSRMTDEYLVTRWKLPVLGSWFSILDDQGNARPLTTWYGKNLPEQLDQAPSYLCQIAIQAVTEEISWAAAWCDFLEITYRQVLEPLGRDIAYRAANVALDPNSSFAPADATQSLFYTQHLAPYWTRIEALLEQIHNDPSQKDARLEDMVACLRELLAYLGMTFEIAQDSAVMVRFDPTFLVSLP
jgi:hypothetical protein